MHIGRTRGNDYRGHLIVLEKEQFSYLEPKIGRKEISDGIA